MRKTVKFLSLVIIMVLFSCSVEPAIDVATESKTLEESVAGKAKIPILVLDYNLNEILGTSSTIHRNKNGITVNFKTKNLIPNNAYTLWFVIFADAGGPPVSTYAAGHVVGGSGKGNFSAHKSVGEIIEGDRVFNFDNPETAEVHLALRSHGPAIPGMVDEQIHSFTGGCDNFTPPGPALFPDTHIVGNCVNIQVAIHPKVD